MKFFRTLTFGSTLLCTSLLASFATAAQPVPQTARQALVEMLFSKTPGTFEKHLPQSTRAALRKARADSGTSMLDGFSLLTGRLNAAGQQLQTFEAGPTLMSVEDPQQHTKFEVMVERDDLRGEEDELELSFHGYKDGETQTAGTKFRFTLTMKQEAGTWRLSDITVAVGVSLSDPEFLKAIAAPRKPTITSVGSSEIPAPDASAVAATSLMSATNEASAVAGLRVLNTAEVTYVSSFSAHGYSCTLSDLGGMGSGGGPTEHQAMLIDPRLASGRKNGYVFKLSGCDGSPATRYHISAVPADASSGTRAFCSDESAVIRFSADGQSESCLNGGKVLQ